MIAQVSCPHFFFNTDNAKKLTKTKCMNANKLQARTVS